MVMQARSHSRKWTDWEVSAALKWYHYDGLSYESIGMMLGRSKTAVRLVILRARSGKKSRPVKASSSKRAYYGFEEVYFGGGKGCRAVNTTVHDFRSRAERDAWVDAVSDGRGERGMRSLLRFKCTKQEALMLLPEERRVTGGGIVHHSRVGKPESVSFS